MSSAGEEPITFSASDDRHEDGVARIVRYGSGGRTARAVAFVAGGFLGGAACLFFPIIHLFTTWGLPLLGIVMGVRAWNTEARIEHAAGTCPACTKPIEIHGGPLQADTQRECPQCHTRLRVNLKTA